MKIGIVITAKNLLELTKAAVESIQTSYDYQLILIDDLSVDDTKEWMCSVPGAIVFSKFTSSLAAKWNMGAECAWYNKCDAVLICNNDILFGPFTIDAVVDRMLKDDVGMVSAHNRRNDLEQAIDIVNLPQPPNPTESPHPDFSCFLLSLDTWSKIGSFDENFRPCYFEDNDYHYRMQQAGMLAIVTTAAPYMHYGSRTQNSVPGGLCLGVKFEKNRAYFIAKHGVDPATYKPVE